MFYSAVTQGSTPLWLGDLSNFGGDGEEYGADTQLAYEADHEEVGAAEGRRDVGDTKDGSSVGSSRNAVVNDLHWKNTRDSGTLDGAVASF